MKKRILNSILVLLLGVTIAACTSIIIVGKHNTVDTEDPIEISTKLDSVSVDVLGTKRNKTIIKDTIK